MRTIHSTRVKAARGHLPFIALLACFSAFAIAFTWQGVLPTMGDDSVSYLTLARHFAGGPGAALVREWAPYHTHFPPLFPLLLAATGGAEDLRVAFLLVAVSATCAAALIYLFALAAFGDRRVATGLVVVFLATPTAWITLKGILSEAPYLAFTMAALTCHERQGCAGRGRAASAALLGLLLGAAWLTRGIGVTLVAAYAIHLAVRSLRRHELPAPQALLALVLPVAMMGAWVALRPFAGSDDYRRVVGEIVALWMDEPGPLFLGSVKVLFAGWIASFNAEAAAPAVPTATLALLGVLALTGTALRIAANKLDGWYALLYLGVVFVWIFPDENRRLLYPVIPLLAVHAAHALLQACRVAGQQQRAGRVLFVTGVAVMLLCGPALVLGVRKALDREPALEGTAYAFAGMREYYETINVARARAYARPHLATLAGLKELADRTPPGSRVMWVRPEYVALLGERVAVPYLYSWDARRLAQEIKERNVEYFIWARIHKADLTLAQGDPMAHYRMVAAYARPAYRIGDDFVALEIDPRRLDLALAALSGDRPAARPPQP